MVFLRILRLRYEVNMLQAHRAQTHVYSPFAHHRLHFKVPTVVLEWKAVLCAKLHQRIRCFANALPVRDRDGEYDVLLGAWLTVPAGAVACMYGILISREPDKLRKTGDLRAIPAVEGTIALTCPESQSRLRERHNSVPLRVRQNSLFQRSLAFFLRSLESTNGALFILGQVSLRLLLRGLNILLRLTREADGFAFNRLRIAVLARPATGFQTGIE